MSKPTKAGGGKPMSGKAAARIQGANARVNGGGVPKGSHAARAQAAAARNSNLGKK